MLANGEDAGSWKRTYIFARTWHDALLSGAGRSLSSTRLGERWMSATQLQYVEAATSPDPVLWDTFWWLRTGLLQCRTSRLGWDAVLVDSFYPSADFLYYYSNMYEPSKELNNVHVIGIVQKSRAWSMLVRDVE